MLIAILLLGIINLLWTTFNFAMMFDNQKKLAQKALDNSDRLTEAALTAIYNMDEYKERCKNGEEVEL